MDTEPRNPADHFGLAAYGRAGRWEASILDSLDRDDEWLAELESDNVYLVIRLSGLAVILEFLQFVRLVLTSERSSNGSERVVAPLSIELGTLGDAPVRVDSDREGGPRCFLIAASGTGTALRLTLVRDDLEMLADALEQVVRELPATARSPQMTA